MVTVTPGLYRVALFGAPASLTIGHPQDETICPRSALKPFQAYRLAKELLARGETVDPEEIAVICSSHSGEERHVQIVGRILEKAGCREGDLQCGQINPWYPSGRAPSPLYSQCSGKHAGFLWLTRFLGADPAVYRDREGPVQRSVYEALSEDRLLRESEILGWRPDGCTAPIPLIGARTLARLYAELATGEHQALRLIFSAMTTHPDLVGGSQGRLATDLMRRGRCEEGDLVAKGGAGGILALGVRDPEAANGRAFGAVIYPPPGVDFDPREMARSVRSLFPQLGFTAQKLPLPPVIAKMGLNLVERKPVRTSDAINELFGPILKVALASYDQMATLNEAAARWHTEGDAEREAELNWFIAWMAWRHFEELMDDVFIDEEANRREALEALEHGVEALQRLGAANEKIEPVRSVWNKLLGDLARIHHEIQQTMRFLEETRLAEADLFETGSNVDHDYLQAAGTFLGLARRCGHELGYRTLGHRLVHLAESTLAAMLGDPPQDPDTYPSNVKRAGRTLYDQVVEVHLWFHAQPDGDDIFLVEQRQRLIEAGQKLKTTPGEPSPLSPEVKTQRVVTQLEEEVFGSITAGSIPSLDEVGRGRETFLHHWQERDFESVSREGLRLAWAHRRWAEHFSSVGDREREGGAILAGLTLLRMVELSFVKLGGRGQKEGLPKNFGPALRDLIVGWRGWKRRLDMAPAPSLVARERGGVLGAHLQSDQAGKPPSDS